MSRNSMTPRLRAGAQQTRKGLTVSSVAIGIGGLVVGVVAGLLIGANIGGNWMTWVSFGSLHGYEATSAFGAVVGGVALGVLSFWLASRRRSG